MSVINEMSAEEIAGAAQHCRTLAAPALIGRLARLVADLELRLADSERREAAMIEAFAREIAELRADFANVHDEKGSS